MESKPEIKKIEEKKSDEKKLSEKPVAAAPKQSASALKQPVVTRDEKKSESAQSARAATSANAAPNNSSPASNVISLKFKKPSFWAKLFSKKARAAALATAGNVPQKDLAVSPQKTSVASVEAGSLASSSEKQASSAQATGTVAQPSAKPSTPSVPKKSFFDSKQTKLKRGQFDKHLSGEMERLKKIKTKKAEDDAKRREHRFTVRGFIRAVDLTISLEKAGLTDDPKNIAKKIFRANVWLFVIATFAFIIQGFAEQANLFKLLLFIVGVWVAFFFLGLGILWLIYLFYVDMKIYNRTKEVERVFPDFLQLASSNISAGMPIDRALWYAVRPNFGVLSKEIELVAKNTIAGDDLASALQDFAKKYDSKVIQRSISLILEGLAAGGELAELLSKIALDIEETRILKRDMAANVTTYVIFITFATVVASPALLGLSTNLLEIISKITTQISTSTPSTSVGSFSFTFANDPNTITNFKIFAMVSLTVSSIFAACIANVIQKGRVKDGLSRIPVFIGISMVIYFVATYVLGGFFSSMV